MQTEDDRNAAHTNAALLLIIYVSRLRGRAAHYMHSGLSAANTHRGLNADFIKGGFIAAYMHIAQHSGSSTANWQTGLSADNSICKVVSAQPILTVVSAYTIVTVVLSQPLTFAHICTYIFIVLILALPLAFYYAHAHGCVWRGGGRCTLIWN